MIDIILLVIGTLGLLVGTFTDFKKREVADWVNFGLIFAGLGIRAIGAVLYLDVWYFLWGAIWFGIAYLFGLVMYYTGQWGGGDCKMIMGLGALFGTMSYGVNTVDFVSNFLGLEMGYYLSFFPHFMFNAFLVGSVYGLVWTIALVFINMKGFVAAIKLKVKERQIKILIAIAGFIFIMGYVALFASGQSTWMLHLMLWMILMLPLFILFVRGVENGCMITMMKIDDLTEGEWIVEDVVVDKKRITGPKDLGVTLAQIKELRKLQHNGKIDAVKVKIGIPFVPAFLIAFIMTYFFGNLAVYLSQFLMNLI